MNQYIEEQTFDKEDFTQKPLQRGEYDNCIFLNCNLLGANLSNFVFSETEFKGCDLSNAKLNQTALKDIKFKDCKLLGLHFDNCNEFLFSVEFENCTLNFSTFYKLNLKKTKFKNCSLQETDFTEADLSQAIFENCDLKMATFDRTILEKADFRTSYNYSLDPENNKIKKAKFSKEGIRGLLDKYDIIIEN